MIKIVLPALMRDVANLAGVSEMTVSRALSGSAVTSNAGLNVLLVTPTGRDPELVEHTLTLAAFARVVGSSPARFLITHDNTLGKWLIPAGSNRKLTEQERAAYMGLSHACIMSSYVGLRSPDPRQCRNLAEVEAGLSALKDRRHSLSRAKQTAPTSPKTRPLTFRGSRTLSSRDELVVVHLDPLLLQRTPPGD